jgi:hypothetical protein
MQSKKKAVVVANQRRFGDDAMSKWAIAQTATADTLCAKLPAEPHMYTHMQSLLIGAPWCSTQSGTQSSTRFVNVLTMIDEFYGTRSVHPIGSLAWPVSHEHVRARLDCRTIKHTKQRQNIRIHKQLYKLYTRSRS